MNLQEYGQYFFALIKRAPGQPADDWFDVLTNSTIPAGLPEFTVPTADMPHHAMTQQIRSSGEVAGRIFLPTATMDANGYYSHPVSPLKDGPTPGSLLWEWRSLGGPPIVTPGEGASSPQPPGLSREEVQAMIDASMENAIKVDDKIALVSSGDGGERPSSLLCAEGGGPQASGDQFLLTARDGNTTPGPWESWTVKRGQ
jgi:hypothetical protein